jgi:hypothetical protein
MHPRQSSPTPSPRSSLSGRLAATLVVAFAAACGLPDEPAGDPAESVATQAALVSWARYLGEVPCEEQAVLDAVLADALIPSVPYQEWHFTPLWRSSDAHPSCVKGTSAELGTDYVRCGFDFSSPAGSALRRYGATAMYYCGTKQFHQLEGVFTQHLVAGETYIFHARNGFWVDDGGDRPYARCYLGMKADGRLVNGGLTQCFRGGTRLHRVGDALVASSLAGYGSQDYRMAIFEADMTRACYASTCQRADISVPLPY